jgi:hypothetical protein
MNERTHLPDSQKKYNCQILIKKIIGGTENPETYRKIGLVSVSVSVWYRNELR